jgi:hypothetical protein
MTDRELVIAVGLTVQEAECWELSAALYKKFSELPVLHPMDNDEVARAIHVIQNKLLGRPAYRQYLQLARNEPAPRSSVPAASGRGTRRRRSGRNLAR